MSLIKIWLQAARLRTLPLAASGILCGAALAWYADAFSWALSGLALLTALLLQILSNFANDYGDAQKGTDNEHRVGPERTVQSGALSLGQMQRAMVFTSVLALISGIVLVTLATASLPQGAWIFYLVLGLLSIAAAILYTVGKRAYGYQGFGDVMVFFFFGLVSVLGTYYLNAAVISQEAIWVAVGIGALSTGVLNLNNMRDIDNDLASGKRTLAAKMGFAKAKQYHTFLIMLGIMGIVGLTFPLHFNVWVYALLMLPTVLLLKDLQKIQKTKDKATLDPYLKKLALGTFLMSIVFVIALVLSH